MLAPDAMLHGLLNMHAHLFSRGVDVSGEALPAGPKIIAANHTVASDPFYVPLAFEEKPYFLFQHNLFKIPVLGWLLKQTGQIPVQRETERAKDALAAAANLLRDGKTIVIFPEGRLVPPGERIHAKTGVIRLAHETGAAIVPLGIHVEDHNLLNLRLPWQGCARSGLWQVGGKCRMKFGAAWKPEPSNIHALTDELMNRVYSLVNEIQKENPCASPSLPNPILQW